MDDETLQEIARQLSCPSGEGGVAMSGQMSQTNAFITERTIEALAPKAGERLAEIGPGNGVLSRPLIAALGDSGSYQGIELSPDMARLALAELGGAGKARVDIHVGDCADAPVDTGSLDGIMAVNVLYFVDDIDGLFAAMAGWLKPGGRAVFGVRSPKSLQAIPFTRYGFRIRTLEEIETALRGNGFGPVESAYYDEGSFEFEGMELPVDSLIIKGIAALGAPPR